MYILCMVYTRCLHALPDVIDVLLKTLYMYRYDFEHNEQQTGSVSLCLSMCSRNVIRCCLDKTATYTFDILFMFFAFMRHEQFLRFECSTLLTTYVLRLCVRSLTLGGCIYLTKYLLHCAQSKLAAVYCVKWDSKSSYWQRSFHILHMRVYDLAIPFSLVFLACRERQASIVLERYFRFDVSLLSILCMLIARMKMGTSRTYARR